MMYEIIDNNPFYKTFWLSLVGLIVFLLLRFVKHYVLALIKNKKHQRFVQNWRFGAETAIWLIYLSWVLYQLIKVNFVVTLVILAVVFLTGWRSWMEFYAGMVLRLERRFQLGDRIETPNGTGTVERFYFQSLVILGDDGRLVHIPYSQIADKVVLQSTDREKSMAQSFTVEVDADNPEMVKEQMTAIAFGCPWTAVTQQVQVNHDGNGRFQVTAKTIDNAVFAKLEHYVRKRANKLGDAKKGHKAKEE